MVERSEEGRASPRRGRAPGGHPGRERASQDGGGERRRLLPRRLRPAGDAGRTRRRQGNVGVGPQRRQGLRRRQGRRHPGVLGRRRRVRPRPQARGDERRHDDGNARRQDREAGHGRRGAPGKVHMGSRRPVDHHGRVLPHLHRHRRHQHPRFAHQQGRAVRRAQASPRAHRESHDGEAAGGGGHRGTPGEDHTGGDRHAT
mmetsp:Transcript_5637/g.12357  ORF Transcript_5637/g.12357 Transcript_5637/m.12357 type:complete len:201 (+) Transcript_5637:305-907(+)